MAENYYSIDEALKELREEEVSNEYDKYDFQEELEELLNNRFLDKEVTVQVAGGGAGPNEWYEEDEVDIDEINAEFWYDDIEKWKISFSLSQGYSWGMGDYDIDKEYNGTARIPLKRFGVKEGMTYQEMLEVFKNISDNEVYNLIYEWADGSID